MRPSLRPPLLLLLMPLVLLLSERGLALHETAWMQRLHRQPELLLGTMPTTAVRGANLARLHLPTGVLMQTTPHAWHLARPVEVQGALTKRDPLGINARGFHEDVFHRDYGSFHPMRRRRDAAIVEPPQEREKRSSTDLAPPEHMETKRRPEMDAAGFYGDTFSNGLGEFWPLKKRWGPVKTATDSWRRWYKRKPEMDSSGFFGDTFSNGFGDFWTMKKKSGQDNINKRKPEMDSAGFYGDTFSNGFGDFWTVKKKYEKRRPEMDSAGFYGDTFSNGFGDFWTVKKRSEKSAGEKASPDVPTALQSEEIASNVQ